jgi:HEPN domain-containing protein
VTSHEEVAYRVRLALGFLAHAQQALALGIYFAAADAAQRASENAAKALIAMREPPGKTHAPADRLAALLDAKQLALPAGVKAAELLDALRALGPELHIEAGYGREQERLAPWEAIDESRARAAVAVAERVVAMSQAVIALARGV